MNDNLDLGLEMYARAYGYLRDAFRFAGLQKPRLSDAFLEEYMSTAAIATKYLETADTELRALLSQ